MLFVQTMQLVQTMLFVQTMLLVHTMLFVQTMLWAHASRLTPPEAFRLTISGARPLNITGVAFGNARPTLVPSLVSM